MIFLHVFEFLLDLTFCSSPCCFKLLPTNMAPHDIEKDSTVTLVIIDGRRLGCWPIERENVFEWKSKYFDTSRA